MRSVFSYAASLLLAMALYANTGLGAGCAWERASDNYVRAYCNQKWYTKTDDSIYVWDDNDWYPTNDPTQGVDYGTCIIPGEGYTPCNGPLTPSAGSSGNGPWVDHYNNYGYPPYGYPGYPPHP